MLFNWNRGNWSRGQRSPTQRIPSYTCRKSCFWIASDWTLFKFGLETLAWHCDLKARDLWPRRENSDCLLVNWISWPIGNRNFPVSVTSHALSCINTNASKRFKMTADVIFPGLDSGLFNQNDSESTIVSEGFKGGTRGSPIMPRDAVARTANVEGTARH